MQMGGSSEIGRLCVPGLRTAGAVRGDLRGGLPREGDGAESGIHRAVLGCRWGVLPRSDDYAFLVFGLLELYEATFEEGYLEKAMELNREFIARFWDADGGFFLTASDGEQLPVRQKDAHDGAIPSANSMAMLNLLRLSRMTGDVGLEEKAAALSRAFPARQHPAAYCMLLCAVDFALGSMEVVISGGRGALLDAVRRTYAPSKVLMLRTERLVRLVPALSSMNAEGTVAFVCRNFSCDAPVSDPELLREKLRA